MSKHLKNWWEQRKAKHYLKSHWHLLADIILVSVILVLTVNLIFIKQSANKPVNTNPVEHVSKIIVNPSEALSVKTEFSKTNIYSGREINLHLILENKGQQDINDLVISPTFSSGNFVVNGLKNETAPSNLKINNNKLILDKLAVGETIEADLVLIVNAKTGSPRSIIWSLKATYKEGEKNFEKTYSLETLKLISDLKVKGAAYYNSQLGDQLGSGPVPPMVGLPTNYWVFFEVDNHGNDLNNLTINAKLSDSVTLAGGKTLSAGEFAYNESQKRITWTVEKIKVANGRYQIGFEVQLSPTEKQVGLKPLLVSNISYLATDAYTGEKLSGKLPYIDTELPLDIINQGQGKVVE